MSGWLFDDEKFVFPHLIFEFSILVESNPHDKLPATDSRIGVTSAEIFKDFYSKNGNNITIYICDSADNKQAIRKRKFDIWFTKYNGTDFFKIDKTLIDAQGNRFPISLILKDTNPQRHLILDLFTKLINQNNDDKWFVL